LLRLGKPVAEPSASVEHCALERAWNHWHLASGY